MVTTPPETVIAPPAPAAAVDSPTEQADRALVNQGDTVRSTWRFSGDAIQTNVAYMSPEAKELLKWAFKWCIDPLHPLRFEEFCDRVGYSPNTIYKMYSGKYLHPESTPANKRLMDAPEKLLKAIREFRRLELQPAKMGRKQFVTTPTVRRIYWAIEQARKHGRPVMIYGGSHIGKTEAFKQNCIDFNHGRTVLVEIEAVNGLRGLLQAIAEKLGISPNATTPDLIIRIKKALTPDMVLILDEVHLLANVYRKGSFFACMEQIRRIWDSVHFGLVLSYTDLGYLQAEQERKRELLQLFRRCVLKVNLGPVPLVEDIHLITENAGLPWANRHESIEIAGVVDSPSGAIKQLAANDGLAAVVERIGHANEMAADDDRDSITWEDFMRAHQALAKQAIAPKTGWEKEGAK